jgi:hypothetical protein
MKKSPIVSGKQFRVTITGEIPPSLMSEDPQLVTAALLGAINVSTAILSYVVNVNCSLGESQPAGPPPVKN